MADFKIGQQIQCKDDDNLLAPYGEQTPVYGRCYTIREIIAKPTGPCLRLREIINPPAHYADGETECSFSATRFEAGVPPMPFFTVRGPLPISGGGGGGSPAWLKTYNSTEITGSGNPITFTAAALGANDATRITVVLAHCESVGQTGMTIGGLTATEAVHEFTSISGLGIWYCDTHTLGTTADIIITAAGNMNNNSIQVGQLTNCTATPTFTNSAPTQNSPASIGLTVPSGGVGIIGSAGVSGIISPSWTNATSEYTFFTAGSMERDMASATASATVTYTFSGGGGNHMVAAAWGA